MSKAKQGATPAPATSAAKAAQAELGRTITHWMNQCKAKFSHAVKRVIKIPATEFSKRLPEKAVRRRRLFFSQANFFLTRRKKKGLWAVQRGDPGRVSVCL
jgi:hypothetical protein